MCLEFRQTGSIRWKGNTEKMFRESREKAKKFPKTELPLKKKLSNVLQAYNFRLGFFHADAATADGKLRILLTKIIVRLEVMEFPVHASSKFKTGVPVNQILKPGQRDKGERFQSKLLCCLAEFVMQVFNSPGGI